jgi:hypothetical protein
VIERQPRAEAASAEAVIERSVQKFAISLDLRGEEQKRVVFVIMRYK